MICNSCNKEIKEENVNYSQCLYCGESIEPVICKALPSFHNMRTLTGFGHYIIPTGYTVTNI